MAKILVRLQIPNRLIGGMIMHEADSGGYVKQAAFDVPATREGVELVAWWEKAANDARDAVMLEAYSNNIPLVDAWRKAQGAETGNV